MHGVSGECSEAEHEQKASTEEIERNVAEAAIGAQLISSNVVTVTKQAAEATGEASDLKSTSLDLNRQVETLRDEVGRCIQEIRAA